LSILKFRIDMRLHKLRQALSRFKRRLRKYVPGPRYNPERFFRARHRRYGFDLRSVGNCTLSPEENERVYQQAGEIFLHLCRQENIDFENASVLDIGCGTGFYTQILRDNGVRRYLGADIIDDRFEVLRSRFPDYSFRQLDITKEPLDSSYDLIIMIDVTQHIVDDRKFSAAMQNVRSHLAEDGVFIVTSWNAEKRTQRTYYEVARPISCYASEFAGYHFSDIIPFRDKFIFSIRKHRFTGDCDR